MRKEKTMTNLPVEFKARMASLLGENYKAFEDSYSQSPSKAVRINTGFITREQGIELLPFKTKELSYDSSALLCFDDYPEKPGRLALHHAGAFYVQEPSAMAPVASVDIFDGMKILDICASPGGKSIAAALQNPSGVIVSNEIVTSRARTLLGNIERMGIKNAIVTNTDSKTLASWYDSVFDLVICDAPCSGEGMFRKSEVAISEWSLENVKMCAARQREIIENASKTVAAGGYLLYSTCTFSLEENEMLVDAFLSDNPEFELCTLKDEVIKVTAPGVHFDGCKTNCIDRCRRFYPHTASGEGQFISLMRRQGDSGGSVLYKDGARVLSKEEKSTAERFLSENVKKIPDMKPVGINKSIWLSPEFPLPPFALFGAGICVGELEKGRIVPHHQLFSALGRDFIRTLELSESEAESYLKGLTLTRQGENGFCTLLYKGLPLGGGKIVSPTVKNHYPKGLRNV